MVMAAAASVSSATGQDRIVRLASLLAGSATHRARNGAKNHA
jgi:hypothetical protein